MTVDIFFTPDEFKMIVDNYAKQIEAQAALIRKLGRALKSVCVDELGLTEEEYPELAAYQKWLEENK